MLRVILLVVGLLGLVACGGGSGAGGGASALQPALETTTTTIAHLAKYAASAPEGPIWPDAAGVGDGLNGALLLGFVWFDVSAVPQDATVDSATLLLPVTLEFGDISTIYPVLLDAEGRSLTGPPSVPDIYLDFEHQLIDWFGDPAPQAGSPPEWSGDVQAAIQSAVFDGEPYVVFRLRPGGYSDNLSGDQAVVAGLWNPTQLQYAATLRVTYTH